LRVDLRVSRTGRLPKETGRLGRWV